MHNDQNPFTNPRLLHPDLADQISDVEGWQQEHVPSTQIGVVGVAAAVRNATKEQTDGDRIEGVSSEFSQRLSSAYSELTSLVTDTQMEASIDVPMLAGPELIDTDWARLDTGFQLYQRLGLQPEIIITPTGQRLEHWRVLYSNLCDWQEKQPQDASGDWRLSSTESKGLYVSGELVGCWDELVPREPGWQVSVIVGTEEPVTRLVDRTGRGPNGRLPQGLADIIRQQPAHPGAALDKLDTYPSVEDYLMLQATRFHRGLPPMDDRLLATWLDGDIYIPRNVMHAYPLGSLHTTDTGYQVFMTWGEDKLLNSRNGVRPIIKG